VKEFNINKAMRRAVKRWKSDTVDDSQSSPWIDLISRGMYARQLKRYLCQFPKSNFLIIEFDKINQNPQRVLQTVYGFIDVSEEYMPSSINLKPKQNSNNSTLIKFENSFSNFPMVGHFADFLHQLLAKTGLKSRRAVLREEIREKLHHLYRPYNDELRCILENLPSRNVIFDNPTEWD